MQMLSGKHVGLPRHATSSSGRTPRPFSGAQGLPSARRKLARAPFAAASGVATTFEFGTGSLQGLRDTMEDQVVAVEDAKLGCIFAGAGCMQPPQPNDINAIVGGSGLRPF